MNLFAPLFKHRSERPARRRRGYTLAELMVALSIFAFSSTAISSLMFATYNTNRHVKGMADASSAAELTLRRIIEVTRSSADLTYTDPQSGLFIQTPPDSSNLSYVFIYYVLNGRLREKIQSASGVGLTDIQDVALVSNINSFTVTRVNPGLFPECYRVDLVLSATPVAISRSATITARNLKS